MLMNRIVSSFLVLLAAAMSARAHFVFVVPEADGTRAKVILSENLAPDAGVDVGLIGKARLQWKAGGGAGQPLTLVKGDHAFEVRWERPGAGLIYGVTDLGIMQRGTGKPHVLAYYPKTILGDALAAGALVGEEAPVELVPKGQPGAIRLQLLAHGKPVADAEITVILPDGAEKKLKTAASGETEALAGAGRFGAWARYWEPASGERDGKKYEELRSYATLVFDAAAAGRPLAALPEATSSFGAVASDGYLYVYGGHIAPTHNYYTGAVSGRFERRRLAGGGAWESLPAGPALQGMNLAAYRGMIYRVGGMAPQNAKGAKTDNRSTAECARFNPAAGRWETLPALPEARSSHDVAVVDGKLMVTGGWNLQGDEETWVDSVAVLDLEAADAKWRSVPQPFRRRALIAASYEGRLWVMGGFNEKNKIVRAVSIYDPRAGAWSEGPELPAGPGMAFAPAAAVHDGRLYVSLSDGALYRLDEAGRGWERVGKASPRLAHRLASSGGGVLSLGGAAGGGNLDLVEEIPVPAAVTRL